MPNYRITDKGVRAMLSHMLRGTMLGLLGGLAFRRDSDMPSEGVEPFAWLGSTPSFKEWASRRTAHRPQAFDFAIKNKKYYLDTDIPLDLIRTDKTGEVQAHIDDHRQALPLWEDELLASLIDNGDSTECFDGQFFFDTDHSYGNSGSFDNDRTYNAADPDAITAEEAALAINQVIEAMRGFPDDQGRKIFNRGMTAVRVVCKAGTPNAAAIRQAITSERIDTGSGTIDNPLRGQDVQIRLTTEGLLSQSERKFQVIRDRANGDAMARPFALQRNMDLDSLLILTEQNAADYVSEQDAWGVRGKVVGNVGYGWPQHACQLEFT